MRVVHFCSSIVIITGSSRLPLTLTTLSGRFLQVVVSNETEFRGQQVPTGADYDGGYKLMAKGEREREKEEEGGSKFGGNQCLLFFGRARP